MVGVKLFGIREFLLPDPVKVLMSIADAPGFYAYHSFATLGEALTGFLGAAFLGTLMAIGVVYSRIIEQTIYTVLVGLHSVPKVALAPLFVIWLGTGKAPTIAIVFIIAIFPIVLNSVQGLRSVEPDMFDLARSMRASESQVLWKIRFPNALPSMFTGFKIGISNAFIGAVVGEFVTSVSGLGYLIINAQSTFDTARMFAAIILLAIIGTILFYIVEFLEGVIIPWHVTRRAINAGT
jgi:NitT/TauT family transport system permease protein